MSKNALSLLACVIIAIIDAGYCNIRTRYVILILRMQNSARNIEAHLSAQRACAQRQR